MPFEVAQTMMLGMVRKMKVGPEIEDQLSKMTPPKPPEAEKPEPDPNLEIKAKAEAAKAQLDMQKSEQAMQMMKLEMEFAQMEHQNKMEELKQKALVNQQKYQTAMQLAIQKAKQPAPTSTPSES